MGGLRARLDLGWVLTGKTHFLFLSTIECSIIVFTFAFTVSYTKLNHMPSIQGNTLTKLLKKWENESKSIVLRWSLAVRFASHAIVLIFPLCCAVILLTQAGKATTSVQTACLKCCPISGMISNNSIGCIFISTLSVVKGRQTMFFQEVIQNFLILYFFIVLSFYWLICALYAPHKRKKAPFTSY